MAVMVLVSVGLLSLSNAVVARARAQLAADAAALAGAAEGAGGARRLAEANGAGLVDFDQWTGGVGIEEERKVWVRVDYSGVQAFAAAERFVIG